jgi:hypothetical protein
MDIADELDESISIRFDYAVYLLVREGSSKVKMSCFRAEAHEP